MRFMFWVVVGPATRLRRHRRRRICDPSNDTGSSTLGGLVLLALDNHTPPAQFGVLSSSQWVAMSTKSLKSTLQSPFISPAMMVSHKGSLKYDLLASAVPP